MDKTEINNKIILKQKEIDLERDPNKKIEWQRDLEILNLRKSIIDTREKINNLMGND